MSLPPDLLPASHPARPLLEEVGTLGPLIVSLGERLTATSLAADVARMQLRAGQLSGLLAEYLKAEAEGERRRLRHDTLNVLGALAGYAELIGEDTADGPARDLAGRIQSGAHALSALLVADRAGSEQAVVPGG